MKKKDNYISFMVVPPSGSKTKTMKVKTKTLKIVLALLSITIIGTSIGLYFSLSSSLKQARYTKLKQEHHIQEQYIKNFDEKLNNLDHTLQGLLEKEEEVRLILGDNKFNTSTFKRNLKKKNKAKLKAYSEAYNETIKESTTSTTTTANTLTSKLIFLENALTITQESLTLIHDKTVQFKTRFASTPSIKPLYGRVLSKYGWRTHPIKRKRKFHKGIDIATWPGSPIQTTADGIIEYSGWSGTFGYVVVIDHDFGYRTIYAHCSQLLVKKGETVKKGEVIAQVGSTGISTGPHLHYEIRKWRQAVDPLNYIDIDMFTASQKIW